jgi:2-oxoisovalerate dehydrogenase E2 component (dihydrolipoyl transacylase)
VPERTFVLPDLGEGLEEAEVAAWLVSEGDTVALNQPIVEVETAKANVEIPSPFAGRIAKLHAAAGDTVKVGSSLVTFEIADVEAEGPPTGSGGGSVAATPAVRKLAKELGVELASVSGTGQGGRVTREDLERAASGASAAIGTQDAEVVPLSMIRRAIAANLTGAAAVPAVTTFRTVDCTALEAFRRELQVSPLPVFVRALAEVCRSHPMLNAEWREDGIRVHARVHVGIAVDTERGLVVPAVRDVGALGIGEVAAEIGRLAAAARDGTLAGDAGTGTTISVSNTGSYGSEAGTPLLNPPNAVTIALGVIAPRAIVVDGLVEARPACTLSCTFDHRVLDGAGVGRALTDLVAMLEDPERLRGLPR